MKAAFKKAKRRFKEQMMEKAGVSEKVSDPIFDEAYGRFQRWNELLTRVEDAHSALLASMQQQSRASTRLADALVQFHFEGLRMRTESDTGFASDVDEHALKEPIERFARVQGYISRALDVPLRFYRSEVIARRGGNGWLCRKSVKLCAIVNTVFDSRHGKVPTHKRATLWSCRNASIGTSKAAELDDETKKLLKTFTALGVEDLGYHGVAMFCMQVHYHKRATEMLGVNFPITTRLLSPSAIVGADKPSQASKVSEFLLGAGNGAEGCQRHSADNVQIKSEAGSRCCYHGVVD